MKRELDWPLRVQSNLDVSIPGVVGHLSQIDLCAADLKRGIAVDKQIHVSIVVFLSLNHGRNLRKETDDVGGTAGRREEWLTVRESHVEIHFTVVCQRVGIGECVIRKR